MSQKLCKSMPQTHNKIEKTFFRAFSTSKGNLESIKETFQHNIEELCSTIWCVTIEFQMTIEEMNTIVFSKLFFIPFGTSSLNTLSWLHDLIIGGKPSHRNAIKLVSLLLVKSHFHVFQPTAVAYILHLVTKGTT